MSKYRSVGGGHVDESLFGETQSSQIRNAKGRLRPDSGKAVAVPTAVISQQELNRIRAEAVYKSEAELAEERAALKLARESREKLARDRKLRMMELEKQANAKSRLSDGEIEQQARERAIRESAATKMDERSDVVKALTSMSARAVAFTIREKQIEEKHRRELIEREYDRSLDLAMEIDRIKDLQAREAEENSKKTKRFDDRKVITEQMDQRARAKAIEIEYREQENVAMRNMMKKYQDDDAAAQATRQAEIEKSRLVILAANEAAIEKKKQAKLMAKKEVEDILIYQAQQDAKLAKREAEEKALERAKKERQALLLAQQERAQNNADKLDEIRARRAMEERERKEREKHRDEAARRRADLEDLQRARSAQASDKRRRDEAAKAGRQREFEDALQHMSSMAKREEDDRKHRQTLANQHRANLASQISEIEAQRQMERLNVNDEGTLQRQNNIRDVAKYSAIRDQMVADLEAKGVNPRYLSEMKSVDISKIIRR